jgi:hypothetical protein
MLLAVLVAKVFSMMDVNAQMRRDAALGAELRRMQKAALMGAQRLLIALRVTLTNAFHFVDAVSSTRDETIALVRRLFIEPGLNSAQKAHAVAFCFGAIRN